MLHMVIAGVSHEVYGIRPGGGDAPRIEDLILSGAAEVPAQVQGEGRQSMISFPRIHLLIFSQASVLGPPLRKDALSAIVQLGSSNANLCLGGLLLTSTVLRIIYLLGNTNMSCISITAIFVLHDVVDVVSLTLLQFGYLSSKSVLFLLPSLWWLGFLLEGWRH